MLKKLNYLTDFVNKKAYSRQALVRYSLRKGKKHCILLSVAL